MIISESTCQAFCHIPKNGGSALRRYLLSSWPDPIEINGRKPVDAAGGKIYDLTHITPTELKHFFGRDLVADRYRVIAVVREPQSRFRSALAQYVKSFGQSHRDYVDMREFNAFLANLTAEALCEEAFKDHRKVYFRPQVAYIEPIDPENRELVLLKNLSIRFEGLKQENVGGSMPSWMRGADSLALRGLVRSLPQGVVQTMRRKLVRRSDVADAGITRFMADNRAYLDAYYAKDRVLYESIAR